MARTLSGRAVKVLTLLEGAKETAKARRFGEWVPTTEFVDKVGINFKVGLIELHHKRRPEKGAGFVIQRKKQETSDDYQYRILKFPVGWTGWRAYNNQIKGVMTGASVEKTPGLRGPSRRSIIGTQLGMWEMPPSKPRGPGHFSALP